MTVEQPVTLVTHSEAIRQNGTCCNPNDPTDCTLCPDDPSVQFTLIVCFRTGGVVGFNTDSSHCPLGRVDRPPNSTPGALLHLTPRSEAASLSRLYPVSQHVSRMYTHTEYIPQFPCWSASFPCRSASFPCSSGQLHSHTNYRSTLKK